MGAVGVEVNARIQICIMTLAEEAKFKLKLSVWISLCRNPRLRRRAFWSEGM